MFYTIESLETARNCIQKESSLYNKNKIEKYSTNEIPFEIETCIHSKPYNLDAIKIIPLFTM